MAVACLAVILHRRIRERKERERRLKLRQKRRDLREDDPLNHLPSRQFEELYRLPKFVCQYFVDLLVPFMRRPKRRTGIPPDRRVLAALRFFAVGCYQRPVGQDMNCGMSQTVMSRVITEVSKIIVEKLGNEVIKFPTALSEMTDIQQKFEQMNGFPGIIGCIDCTHVCIKPPEHYREQVYYSVRKTSHTKNVQIICDADLKILNINARYGGTAHDSFIWSTSAINRYLKHKEETGQLSNAWLLGDSGYSQLPWLMIPFLTPENPAERRYNVKHKSTRLVVERCIGVLKSRFRCLSRQRILMYSPEVAGTIINACAILHNIMIEAGFPLPPEEEIDAMIRAEGDENEEDNQQEILNIEDDLSPLERGRYIRSRIVNMMN